MKIFFKKLNTAANNISNNHCHIKTKPYPNDSVNITARLENKQTLWQRFCNLFRVKKLNPKSFSDGLHTPKGPYVASEKSVQLSNKYLGKNYLSENDRIIDGFRDGGHSAKFGKFGDIISGNREVITIDLKLDAYLRNAIRYAKENTAGLSEKEKVKYIYKIIHNISGDFQKGDKRALILGEKGRCQEILLGKVFEKEAATCRHKALMFKILSQECGLKTRMIRGAAIDLGGFGGHVWNEVKLSNGRKLLVDVQNSIIVDISTPKALKNPKIASYCNQNLEPIYK